MKIPSPLVSLLPVAVLVVLLFFTIRLLGADALGGGSQICLLLTTALCAALGMGRYGVSWKDIEHAIINNIAGVSSALIILLIIGALSAAWMLGGVVPTLIYYGVQIIHPKFFLVSCCVICAVVSVMTGSSWTTIATIGIALMGIGKAQGFEEGWIAGAIISGAYFGDKVSPLSDTTNLAAAIAGTNLFTHIRYMLYTTLPTIFVTLIIFTILSIGGGKIAADVSVADTQRMITDYYYISPVLFLVPLAAVAMIVFKMPPVPVLFVGSLLGGVMAVVCQPELIGSLSGDGTLTAGGAYRVVSRAMYGTVSPETGDPMVDSLFTSRGMAGMLNTVWLIITAMIFGGVMEAGQFLERITTALIRRVRSTGGLVSATAGTCVLFNSTASDQYLAIVIPGKIFGSAYRRKGLAPEVLSRTLEDAGTATSVLIPWNTCGATQAGVLNVATVAYLPYAFFCYISPLMSILFAWLGLRIRRIPPQGALPETENRNK